ncbi:MAG: peptide chain release factor N(5)-glutamine methyltransferase [Succinivibrionaceae bacterium]|nr:peptide chain release factor N(5)-glutamine methyltransferase [Succinivibrionaceae bacterium]
MRLGLARALLRSRLRLAGREEPGLEAELLLCRATSRNRAALIAHDGDSLSVDEAARVGEGLTRALAGEPMAYILGHRGFYDLDLEVGPGALIPRPETELLVEVALRELPAGTRILDLGTGSGAIALALAAHLEGARVCAVDQSAAALGYARRNARRLCLGVEFLEGSWYGPVGEGRFGAIVSNPPYIAAGDPHLARGGLPFEPQEALASGADGLDAIREIVAGAPAHLLPGGALILEHGLTQGAAVRALLGAAGLSRIATERDLEGRERVTYGFL